MSKFEDLGLNKSLLRALEDEGYEKMTPIQSQAIPDILNGADLIGIAQTGTGKTAAFSVPIIQHLVKGEGKRVAKTARSLILAPTRELAVQISDNVKAYSQHMHLRTALVYGGASSKSQIKAVAGGVDILIATPGRLLDLTNQGYIILSEVEILVLDEADRMLDMGFIRDIQKIVARLPKVRQTVFFSATMPKAVEKLANSILTKPKRVEVAPASTTAEKVEQHVLFVPKANKRALLAHILKNKAIERVLIFTRTKHGANRVARNLEQLGVSSAAIHGNKSQNARQKALNEFRAGEIRALVATDVAARGIDVEGVTHVINFDLPNEPESYVHRIGRTARAGAAGVSLSFCDHEERPYLRDIEKIIRQEIPTMEDHPFHQEGMELHNNGAGTAKDAEKPARPARSSRPRSNSGKNKPNRRGDQSQSSQRSKPQQAKAGAGGQRKGRPGKKGSRSGSRSDSR